MAQPSMVVRVAANLAELRKNMAEGRDQIEATRAGFQKLATSFQGDKIIQAAHNAAAAVNQIGGASKLTEAEQARVNRTVEAALAKYAALGREAPSALRQLADETRRAEAPTSIFSSAVGRLASGFAIGSLVDRAVGSLGSYVAKAFESAGATADMADKLGTTTTAIQQYAYVAAQTGTTTEAFTAAAFKLGINLAGGNESVKAAVGALKLEFESLRAQRPEDQFVDIADALGLIEDPNERNRLGVALFGKTFAEIAPSVASGYRDMAKEAGAASDEQIRALDAAGDALGRMQNRIGSFVTKVAGEFSIGLEQMGTVLKAVFTGPIEKAPDVVEKVTAATVAAAPARRDYNAQLQEARTMMDRLTAADQSQIATAQQLGVSVKELADEFDISEAALTLLNTTVREAETRQKQFAAEGVKKAEAAAREAANETKRFWTEVETLNSKTQFAIIQTGKWTTELVDTVTLLSRTTAETGRMQGEMEKWANTNGAVFAPSIKSSMDAAATSAGGFMSKLKGMFGVGSGEGGSTSLGSVLGAIGPQFAGAFLGPGSAGDKMKAFATQAAGTLMGMIPGVGPWLQQFSGPIIAGLTKLASKAKDLLSGIFGGPSATEKEQRTLVKTFEEDLARALTEQQKLEAGGESWKETVIAIRDAYIAQGRTAAEAEADAKRLWESSKQGAGATAAVIADIERKMREAAAAGVDMANRVGDAIDGIPRDVDVNVNFRRNGDETEYAETPGFSSGSRGIRDFGKGTLAVLHGRERVQTEAQMKAEHKALTNAAGVTVDGGGSEIAGEIRRMFTDLKMTLPLAMRDALQGAR